MKKTYERPKLVEHGDIRKMTRGPYLSVSSAGGGGGSNDGDGGNNQQGD